MVLARRVTSAFSAVAPHCGAWLNGVTADSGTKTKPARARSASDGQMLDMPHLKQAQNLLAMAK